MKDYYKILGVKKDATKEEIRNRYIELVKQHHPDAVTPISKSEEILKEINEAYEVLKEDASRLDYDLRRSLFRAYHKEQKIGPRRLKLGKRSLSYAPILFFIVLLTGLFLLGVTSLKVKDSPPANPQLPVMMTQASGSESKSIGKIELKPTRSVVGHKEKKALLFTSEASSQDSMPLSSEAIPNQGRPEEDPFRSSPSIAEEKKEAPVTEEDPKRGATPRAALSSENLGATDMESFPSPSPLSDEEVRRFLNRYIDHYVRKDLEGFLSLFSPKAIQNGRDGMARIKEIYGKFFERSERLTYRLDEIKITINRNISEVRGRYQVSQKLKNRPEEKIWEGDIRWKLAREEETLRIFALDYQPIQ